MIDIKNIIKSANEIYYKLIDNHTIFTKYQVLDLLDQLEVDNYSIRIYWFNQSDNFDVYDIQTIINAPLKVTICAKCKTECWTVEGNRMLDVKEEKPYKHCINGRNINLCEDCNNELSFIL